MKNTATKNPVNKLATGLEGNIGKYAVVRRVTKGGVGGN
jgi:hypothetical protein